MVKANIIKRNLKFTFQTAMRAQQNNLKFENMFSSASLKLKWLFGRMGSFVWKKSVRFDKTCNDANYL